ncbi:MAG: PAS domain S-box protein [Pseudomonadales bacterium]
MEQAYESGPVSVQEAEPLFRSLMEAAPDPMIVADLDGHIILVNRRCEQVFGYEREELVGQPVESLVPERLRQVHRRDRAHYQAMPRVRPMGLAMDLRGRHKDGREIPVEISLSPTIIQERTLIIATIRDVAERQRLDEERKQLEERLRHAQKMESLGVLAGGVAHEFNNALGAIMANADLALLKQRVRSEAGEELEDVIESARRAAGLCKQMLAYSGGGQLIVEQIDLSSAILDMRELLTAAVSEQAALNFELDSNLPRIAADVSQLHQAILNPVLNASEALPEQTGTITVSTGSVYCSQEYLEYTFPADGQQREGEYVYAQISDTGCGMSEGIRARMFDPFFSTKFTGRGLGMAAVLGIVSGHGGAIHVHSEIGTGTTVKLLIPAIAYA